MLCLFVCLFGRHCVRYCMAAQLSIYRYKFPQKTKQKQKKVKFKRACSQCAMCIQDEKCQLKWPDWKCTRSGVALVATNRNRE